MANKQRHTNIKSEEGQSLIEIVVALAVGSILIGAAVVGIVLVLRSGAVNQKSETASSLARDLLLRARSVADADWAAISTVEKGPDFLYYVAASGTELAVVRGEEGVTTDAPSMGLVARWGFDESIGDILHNALPNGTAGRAFGTSYSASCRVGGCRVFNGSGDLIFFGNDPALNLQNAFTLSLWMRASEIPSFPDTGLLSKGGLRYGLTYNNDGNVWFYVGDKTNATRAPVSPGGWHHVAGVFDGSSPAPMLRLYIDGIAVATTTSSFSLSGAEGDLVIGQYNSNYFSGRIDDVRVYDRALAPTEVYALYNGSVFTRSLTLERVYRNPAGEIVSPGGTEDPSTIETSARVRWVPSGSSEANFELKDYLTRWRNEVFHQTDWSSGPEPLSPSPEPGGGYSNSSNILFSPGEIRINEL
ncbi:MAG: LamG-like jellyroll fold domain-containing protein [Nanoarchaeota archaeon]|nr:LamG-like jellyroll fold domain-containing protein [Nanoarchaeota archaeon]